MSIKKNPHSVKFTLREEGVQIKSVEEIVGGVYFLLKNSIVVYVGKSINAIARIHTHKKDKEFTHFAIIECDEDKMRFIESDMIAKYQPLYNKSFPVNEDWICVNKKIKEILSDNSDLKVADIIDKFKKSESRCVIDDNFFLKVGVFIN